MAAELLHIKQRGRPIVQAASLFSLYWQYTFRFTETNYVQYFLLLHRQYYAIRIIVVLLVIYSDIGHSLAINPAASHNLFI